MMMGGTTAIPLMMVARAIVGMLGVIGRLRDFIGMLVATRFGPLYLHDLVVTGLSLRNLVGTLVMASLGLLYLGGLVLGGLVLARFGVWLRTRHVGFLPDDGALRPG